MAITKTTTLDKIVIHPSNFDMENNDLGPSMQVVFRDFIDDPDDDTLPIENRRTAYFNADSDVSGLDAMVQNIYAAVFGE